MQLHQIELIPGESLRVGHLIVTLLEVDGNEVSLQIEDTGAMGWGDPMDFEGADEPQLALV